jgi:hypothetical protein
MCNVKNTNEALREQVAFLVSPSNFSLDLLLSVREGIFVIYATIALNMSVTLATVAGLFSEGWLSHLVS